jgi:sulfite exporter TauE/SafE
VARSELKDRLRQLPRWAYWLAGAVVACTGALIANRLSAGLPVTDRLPYWLAGSVLIFLGLYILSLGTRARLSGRDDAGA